MLSDSPIPYRDDSFDEAWLTRCSVRVIRRQGEFSVVEIADDGRWWDGLMAPLEATATCITLEKLYASTRDVPSLKQPISLVRTGYGLIAIVQRDDAFKPAAPRELASLISLLKVAHSVTCLVKDERARGVAKLSLTPFSFTLHGSQVYLHGLSTMLLALDNPEELQPYLAPENHRKESVADQRGDLYSLAVIFAHWLTGKHPLEMAGAPDWRQAHLTVKPTPISAENLLIPDQLSSVLLRAMAKDPADRYQSMESFILDLQQCLQHLEHAGEIPYFDLGRADPPLSGAGKNGPLVGRDHEWKVLQQLCIAVCEDETFQAALLEGPPGIGKSYLIASFLSGLEGWVVATGKSELLQRDIPFGPWAQIFKSLISQAMGWSTSALEALRNRLISKLGRQARVLVDLVPEAELLVGVTEPLNPLPAAHASTRVNQYLTEALSCFSEEKPLAVFLDDIQWIDTASASLIRSLGDAKHPKFLMLLASRTKVGAEDARDKIVDTLASSNSATPNVLKLAPLSVRAVGQLLAQQLRVTTDEADSLASTLHVKTLGNPFFIKQIFSALINDGKVIFDSSQQKWTWCTDQLAGLAYADSVLTLMLENMERLPASQRCLLALMGCIGAWCPETLLASLSEQSLSKLQAAISSLHSLGLVRQINGGVEFPHDRLLEASYALTPSGDKAKEHARIAHAMILLWQDNLEDHCFEISNQLEKANGHISASLAELAVPPLCFAASRAKSSAAFARAAEFMVTARLLSNASGWSTSNQETQRILRLSAECELLIGRYNDAEKLLDTCLANANAPVDKARAYGLKASLYELRSDYENSVSAVLNGLALLGIELARNPSAEDMDQAYCRVHTLIDGRPIEDLGGLPLSSDEHVTEALILLSALIPTFFVDPNLTFTHLAKMVELTLMHGATAQSGHGFAWFGVKVGERYGAYHEGASLAAAGKALTQAYGTDSEMASVLVAYDQIVPWTMPIDVAIRHARQAQGIGSASGNVPMACYASNHLASDLIFSGVALPSVMPEIQRGLAIIGQYSYVDIERILRAQEFFIRDLMHGFRDKTLSAAIESRFPSLDEQYASKSTVFLAYLYIAMAGYHFGTHQLALEAWNRISTLTWAWPAHINLSDFYLYGCLIRLEAGSADADSLEYVQQCVTRFEEWASLNAKTFRHKALLVNGVLARLNNHDLQAIRHFDQAGIAAAAGGFVHEQAIAHELLARTCESNGLVSGAHHHWRVARDCYQLWGAAAKANALTLNHPFLMASGLAEPNEKHRNPDLEIGIKAAQALSQEILHDRLVETLMNHLMRHAGATSGSLLTVEEGRMSMAASCHFENGRHEISWPSEHSDPDAPSNLLLTVMRTKQLIVIQDATADCPDSYRENLHSRGARSVLCLPLVKQGSLIGLVYLENNLVGDVFSTETIAVLEMLATQAAVSLETARLYSRLVEANEAHARTEAELRASKAELARSSQLAVMGELSAAIAHEISQPLLAISSNASASLKWLNRDEPNLNGVAQGLEDIRSDGRRAANIIQALRSLAKQQAPSLVEFDITHLIDEVLRLMMNDIRHSQVKLALRIASSDIVKADKTQLQQVLYNILSNALEAMLEQPAENRRLEITTALEGERLCVYVDDSGPGVDQKQAEKMFEAFYTTKGSGLGMGLAICRSVMRAHGGSLEVTASPIGGCRMMFSLPLAESVVR